MAKKGRPLGSKNKKTNEGLVIINAEEMTEKKKSTRRLIREYLIANGEIKVKDAFNNGWVRLPQYMSEFKKEGMNIKSIRKGDYVIKYVLKSTEAKNENIEDVKNKTEIKEIKTTMQDTILKHLEEFGSITSFQARDLYNCINLPQTIRGLRIKGYNIVTSEERNHKSQNTKVDRVQACAIYTLEKPKTTKTTYVIYTDCELQYMFAMPVYEYAYESKEKAFRTLSALSHTFMARLSLLAGSNTSYTTSAICDEFGNNGFCVEKTEKIKRLFRKTEIKKETVSKFFMKEVKTEE